MDKLIVDILTTRRAHNSPQELQFLGWLRDQLIGVHKQEVITLAEGCVAVVIGKNPKTLFSCHIDTVHSPSADKQPIFYDENFGHIFLDKSSNSNCLGADDGAGIYVLLKMIEAKVPGGYIFHRGEERGGIGAHAVLKENAKWLKQFKACVAFDRPRCDEVIIHQGGVVCASNTYGQALADALNKHGFTYAPSTKGVFTDSKVYRYDIPECINLGVGYEFQHGKDEMLDWNHLKALTEAAIKIDWDKLPIARKPEPAPVYTPPRGSLRLDFGGGAFDKRGRAIPKIGKRNYYEDEEPVGRIPFSVDLKRLSAIEIEEMVGDEDLTNAICDLLCELDAEKAKVSRLYTLLGMT